MKETSKFFNALFGPIFKPPGTWTKAFATFFYGGKMQITTLFVLACISRKAHKKKYQGLFFANTFKERPKGISFFSLVSNIKKKITCRNNIRTITFLLRLKPAPFLQTKKNFVAHFFWTQKAFQLDGGREQWALRASLPEERSQQKKHFSNMLYLSFLKYETVSKLHRKKDLDAPVVKKKTFI